MSFVVGMNLEKKLQPREKKNSLKQQSDSAISYRKEILEEANCNTGKVNFTQLDKLVSYSDCRYQISVLLFFVTL